MIENVKEFWTEYLWNMEDDKLLITHLIPIIIRSELIATASKTNYITLERA